MKIPRILFAAPASGMGKTTITCGFLAVLKKRNVDTISFKCGPDYIDTLFHSHVLGVPSYNIDTFLTGEKNAKFLFYKNAVGKKMAVIEGVMGYYDGLGSTTLKASSYDVANVTKTPVIMVIRPKGMSLSVAALLKGFLQYQQKSYIKGVILNGVSQMFYQTLKDVIEKELPIKVYGYLPQKQEFTLQSRHLGLVTPDDTKQLQKKLYYLAEEMEKNMDIEGIMSLAESAEELPDMVLPKNEVEKKCTIAVAKDRAFCFYYKDNLQYLEENGCQLVYFSPLKDKNLPKEADGIFLGGGYPELYAKELSQNNTMIVSIKNAIAQGMPVWAECGGFLYLHETLQDAQEKSYAMVGAIKAHAFGEKQLKHFGYITLQAQKDTFLCKKGESIPAHEFHYWQSTNPGNAFLAEKYSKKRSWQCIHDQRNIFAGFAHIHFYGNTIFADNWIKQCIQWRREKKV